jgi:hypothetical protein
MKHVLQLVIALVVFSGVGSQAEIISVTGHGFSAGPITNTLVDFTNFDSGGCSGVSPCIVGASILPIDIFESGFTTVVTFTYSSNFDFNYGSTGPGDRIIIHYPEGGAGFGLTLGLNGGNFYLGAPPYGIPDIGTPGVTTCAVPNGITNVCYAFNQDLSSTSGLHSVTIPQYPYPGTFNGLDLYLAIDGLNPNGGTFTLTQTGVAIAPEPSSLILLTTGFSGIIGIGRRKLMSRGV